VLVEENSLRPRLKTGHSNQQSVQKKRQGVGPLEEKEFHNWWWSPWSLIITPGKRARFVRRSGADRTLQTTEQWGCKHSSNLHLTSLQRSESNMRSTQDGIGSAAGIPQGACVHLRMSWRMNDSMSWQTPADSRATAANSTQLLVICDKLICSTNARSLPPVFVVNRTLVFCITKRCCPGSLICSMTELCVGRCVHLQQWHLWSSHFKIHCNKQQVSTLPQFLANWSVLTTNGSLHPTFARNYPQRALHWAIKTSAKIDSEGRSIKREEA